MTWYCLGRSYVFPTLFGGEGHLVLSVDGTPFLDVVGLSVLEDQAVLNALLVPFVNGDAIVSNATRLWIDDLVVSTAPVNCE